MAIYFISETYIKEHTPLSQNIDPKDILPFIEPSQDMYIQDLLGQNFYLHLWNSYSAQTLTADEITLVEKIKKAHAYRAAEMALDWIDTQVKNKGIQTQSGDFSAASDKNDMKYKKNSLKNMAEFYEERVVKYLSVNGSLYPQYTSDNSTDILPDKKDQFTCGIVFYPESNPLNNGFYN